MCILCLSDWPSSPEFVANVNKRIAAQYGWNAMSCRPFRGHLPFAGFGSLESLEARGNVRMFGTVE